MTGKNSTRPAPLWAYLWIAAISVFVLGFLLWLIYVKPQALDPPAWSDGLPAANAIFNGLSAVCLILAVLAIRRGKRARHVALVLSALGFSVLFLCSYILHHAYHGNTQFGGEGLVRPIYFFILISHIALSMAIVPLILSTVFLALSRRFEHHRKLARITFPAWLYVSVSGILVFLFLKVYA